jgi:hypothetical protein
VVGPKVETSILLTWKYLGQKLENYPFVEINGKINQLN